MKSGILALYSQILVFIWREDVFAEFVGKGGIGVKTRLGIHREQEVTIGAIAPVLRGHHTGN